MQQAVSTIDTSSPSVLPEPTSPLRIADYRKFWLARFAVVFASTGMVVIIGYQLYDVARSVYGMSIAEASFQLGLLGFAQFLPIFLLTPVAGVIADRFDRRKVAGIAMSVDILVAIGLALITELDLRSLPVLYLFAALHGIARVFVSPSMTAIAPNIVPTSLIPRAIAFNSIAIEAGTIIGPAAFGFLFARHHAMPYWIAAVLMAVAAFSITSIRNLPPVPKDARRDHPVRQIVDGFHFIWRERFLLGCITLDLFAVLLGGATALMPVFARDILHVGPEGLGQMRAATAAGAAIVAVWLSFRPRQERGREDAALGRGLRRHDRGLRPLAQFRCVAGLLGAARCGGHDLGLHPQFPGPASHPGRQARKGLGHFRPRHIRLERAGRDAVRRGRGPAGRDRGCCFRWRRCHSHYRNLGLELSLRSAVPAPSHHDGSMNNEGRQHSRHDREYAAYSPLAPVPGP